jgi:hypothetical protein
MWGGVKGERLLFSHSLPRCGLHLLTALPGHFFSSKRTLTLPRCLQTPRM